MVQWIQSIDNNILGFVQANLHNVILDKILPFISMIGNDGAIWVAIAAVFLSISKYKKYGIMIVVAVLLSALSGEVVLKPLLARVRPCNLNTFVPMLIPRPADYSFPSGHTSASFAATFIIWKANRNFGVFALLLAFFIAFSRLYLYVHYPTDILAGMVLGLLCGAAAIGVINTIYKKKSLDGRL